VLVKTEYGILRGKMEADTFAFLGIPYAKAPVGALRWREPQPPECWEGIREAKEFGSPSAQAPSQVIPGGDPADRGVIGNGSEDCLYLNVWTPNPESNEKLPVFVWIHGGAFCCGSGGGKSASPAPFCSRGIVYVTLNYRLGIMGYFAHPELSAESVHHVSGNYAHFDQIAALQWVRKNIAAFGGDPKQVTVGGCSAGAGSTQVLCNSPLAKGLFCRAVIHSSVSLSCALYPEDNKLETMEEMEERGMEYMKMAGCKNLAQMRSRSYEELIAFPECGFRKKFHYGTTMGISEDGYLLPRHYKYSMENMENLNIPYLVGNTNDEGGEHMIHLGKVVFEAKSREVFGDRSGEYLSLCEIQEDVDAVRAASDTHLAFARAKAFAQINNDAGRESVYVFNFSRKDTVKGKAYHGLETRYLLDTCQALKGAVEADGHIAGMMQEYWSNFIKSGNPNGPKLPKWEPYSSEQRCVLYLDDPVEARWDSEQENILRRFAREFMVEKLTAVNRLVM